MTVENLLDLHGIIAEDPFNPPIQLSEKTISRTDKPGANLLTRFYMPLLQSIAQQKKMPCQASAARIDRRATQARHVKLRNGHAGLRGHKVDTAEQVGFQCQKMVVQPRRQIGQVLLQNNFLTLRMRIVICLYLHHQVGVAAKMRDQLGERWYLRHCAAQLGKTDIAYLLGTLE